MARPSAGRRPSGAGSDGRGARSGARFARWRQRLLQAGFALAALAAVAVTDRTASAVLMLEGGLGAHRLATGLALAGRMVGGWALGMAFRLQFARAVETDRGLRLLLGVPACLVATWPLAATYLPAAIAARLPAWFAAATAANLAPFAAVVLGLVLALGVTGRRR